MSSSTSYIIIGLLFSGLGGGALASDADPLIVGVLMLIGSLTLTIGAIAKGVRLGIMERDDERARETQHLNR